MSSHFPRVSSRDAIKAFIKLGWLELPSRRGKGSHTRIYHEIRPAILTVPHRKTLAVGTLRSLIADSGNEVAEFVEALR